MTTDDAPRGAGSPPADAAAAFNNVPNEVSNEIRARIAAIDADRNHWRHAAEQANEQLDRLKSQSAGASAPNQDAETIDQIFDPAAPVLPVTDRGRFAVWLGKVSIDTLRVCLGLIFLGFGVLKFFPETSPAEDIAQRTVDTLTLGLISGDTAGILVALIEVSIGFCLVTGRFLKIGLGLLGMAMIGILSPLVLYPEDLFAGRYHAPTLLGQYVIKDIVLLAAGVVVIARELGKPPDQQPKWMS